MMQPSPLKQDVMEEDDTYDDIINNLYCVPANQENELYAQIRSYGIRDISRSEIEWVTI